MEDFSNLLRILQVVVGIGMVIFIHESGHFIAARMCGVRVDVFSLGFGPRLLSWSRGGTVYQLAAVPLGGYVKMKGEESFGAADVKDPDDLQSKSVGQRFFIYSAGVLMNLLLGVVLFPLLFAHGVPFTQPLVGEIDLGGPAWQAGLDAQDEVLSIDGRDVYRWDDIFTSVALGDPGGVELRIRSSETGAERLVEIKPAYHERAGIYTLGVRLPVDPDFALEITPGSPAEEAGLRTGDRLLAVQGGREHESLLDQLRDALRQPEAVGLQVQDDEGARWVQVSPRLEDTDARKLGITAPFQHVIGVRQVAGAAAPDLEVGDRISSLGGAPVLRKGDFADLLLHAPGVATQLRIRRANREHLLQIPASDRKQRLLLVRAIAIDADMQSTRVSVSPDSPAAGAGIMDGDRIQRVDGAEVREWSEVVRLIGEAGVRAEAVQLDIERPAQEPDGLPRLLSIVASPSSHPMPVFGLQPRAATYVYKAPDAATSVRVGLICSWRFVEEAWITLKRMLQRQVSPENIGGIITIGAVSYGWASEGAAKLLFFLGMLSINLAFINVLPIPVLDGGHLFFLLIEKLKGSPVSEQVMGYSQMIGLVLILSLMVYVTFNDITRWFF